ncbi:MAG: tetratricopeptide repeat protein [Limnothrix sp. RL_2_0]|nr:tetratricopeptide repeat protein [Limnothrix sp. RL_2_0]
MPRHQWFVALGACVSVLCAGTPVRSQAVLPLVHELNQDQLEQQGMMLIEDAIQLSRFQQYEWAIPRAKLATQLVPTRFESWYILGTLLVQEEEYAEGIRVLNRAKKLESKESGIYSILGAAYFQSGDYAKAIPELETALGLGDDSIEVLFDLGNAQFKLERYDAAIATYKRSIKLRDDFWPAINNVGLIQFEQGDISGAIESWEKAIAIDPTAAEPMLAVAVATYVQGDTTKGLELAREALILDSRYADLEFLDENLWGEDLLKATETIFATPTLESLFNELGENAFKPEQIEP